MANKTIFIYSIFFSILHHLAMDSQDISDFFIYIAAYKIVNWKNAVKLGPWVFLNRHLGWSLWVRSYYSPVICGWQHILPANGDSVDVF